MGKVFFIFGAGYSGLAAAARIQAGFVRGTRIFGTTRHREYLPLLQAASLTPLIFDGKIFTAEIKQALARTTHLIITVPPQPKQGDIILALPNLAQSLPKLKWLAYFSALGVYGDAQGAWLDEDSPLCPVLPRAIARQRAEAAWQDFAAAQHVPCAILRLGGIYGGNLAPQHYNPSKTDGPNRFSRNPFRQLAAGTVRRLIKQGQVFNYIHVGDIAGATGHFAARKTDGIFNLCDGRPAAPQDFICFAAGLMGKAAPPAEDFTIAAVSPALRNFYQDNRRVSSRKLQISGYRLLYPDYKTGLTKIWQSRNW